MSAMHLQSKPAAVPPLWQTDEIFAHMSQQQSQGPRAATARMPSNPVTAAAHSPGFPAISKTERSNRDLPPQTAQPEIKLAMNWKMIPGKRGVKQQDPSNWVTSWEDAVKWKAQPPTAPKSRAPRGLPVTRRPTEAPDSQRQRPSKSPRRPGMQVEGAFASHPGTGITLDFRFAALRPPEPSAEDSPTTGETPLEALGPDWDGVSVSSGEGERAVVAVEARERREGDRLMVRSRGRWRLASVTKTDDARAAVRVHFAGESHQYDQWVQASGPDVQQLTISNQSQFQAFTEQVRELEEEGVKGRQRLRDIQKKEEQTKASAVLQMEHSLTTTRDMLSEQPPPPPPGSIAQGSEATGSEGVAISEAAGSELGGSEAGEDGQKADGLGRAGSNGPEVLPLSAKEEALDELREMLLARTGSSLPDRPSTSSELAARSEKARKSLQFQFTSLPRSAGQPLPNQTSSTLGPLPPSVLRSSSGVRDGTPLSGAGRLGSSRGSLRSFAFSRASSRAVGPEAAEAQRERDGSSGSLRGASGVSLRRSTSNASAQSRGGVSTNALQKMLLDLATNASTLASSVLNCQSCGSANVALDGGTLNCRTCFQPVPIPQAIEDQARWRALSTKDRMVALLSQTEGISKQIADLAAIYGRPTASLAAAMVPSTHAKSLGGGVNYGAAFRTRRDGQLQDDWSRVTSRTDDASDLAWMEAFPPADAPDPTSVDEDQSDSAPSAVEGTTATSVSERALGVSRSHPSTVILKGPADPRDLEASVRQFRSMVKSAEQVRYYENLLTQVQKDHIAEMEKAKAEWQKSKDTLSRWCDHQVEYSEKLREKSYRNHKAREIFRILRLDQLSKDLKKASAELEDARADRVLARELSEEVVELRAALKRANQRLEELSDMAVEATKLKRDTEHKLAQQELSAAAKEKMRRVMEEARFKRVQEREQVKAIVETKQGVESVQRQADARHKLLLDTLLHNPAPGAGSSFPPTAREQRRDELVKGALERSMRSCKVLLEELLAQARAADDPSTLKTGLSRMEEVFRGQGRTLLDKLHHADAIARGLERDVGEELPETGSGGGKQTGADNGSQTVVLGSVNSDPQAYTAEGEGGRGGARQKSARAAPRAKSRSRSRSGRRSEPPANRSALGVDLDDRAAVIKRARDAVWRAMELKPAADAAARQHLPFYDHLFNCLLTKVWMMPAAQAEAKDVVQCIHAARSYDPTAWLYGRLLGLFQVLPSAFLTALSTLRTHSSAFKTKLSKSGEYYRSGTGAGQEEYDEVLVVAVSDATAVLERVVEQLRLRPWTPPGSVEFKTDSLAKLVVKVPAATKKDARTDESMSPGTVRRRGREGERRERREVVTAENAVRPLVEAWGRLQAEWLATYRERSKAALRAWDRDPATDPVSTQRMGHFAEALEAALPAEVWGALAQRTNGLADLFRTASLRPARDLTAWGVAEVVGGTEEELRGRAEEAAEALFLELCGEAWQHATSSPSAAHRTPRDRPAPERQDPQPEGMGAPFGLTVGDAGSELAVAPYVKQSPSRTASVSVANPP